VWPNGTLALRDVAGKSYTAEQFFTKNINRYPVLSIASSFSSCARWIQFLTLGPQIQRHLQLWHRPRNFGKFEVVRFSQTRSSPPPHALPPPASLCAATHAAPSAGFVSKYIPLVAQKGSKVNPAYLGISALAPSPAFAHRVMPPPPSLLLLPADLTNYTMDNIKGFNSYVPLPAYVEMLKKPQCEP
jgi:hypothetical protein